MCKNQNLYNAIIINTVGHKTETPTKTLPRGPFYRFVNWNRSSIALALAYKSWLTLLNSITFKYWLKNNSVGSFLLKVQGIYVVFYKPIYLELILKTDLLTKKHYDLNNVLFLFLTCGQRLSFLARGKKVLELLKVWATSF